MASASETRAVRVRSLAFAVAVLAVAVAAAQDKAPPTVSKIEPPNWWIGLPDPMLLLTGEHLAGARVTTDSPGVRIVRTADGRDGKYEFVWLKVGKTASPADVKLRVGTAEGTTKIRFPVAARNPAGERSGQGFNGFGVDDVIYLIMPDRFDDGDLTNNFPDSGSYDRHAPRAYHGGDLRGIQRRLPYLKDLGVTAIWITPVYQNDDRTGRDYHGYGATDLYAVERHLGTIDDYRSLVKAAHEQGLKVLLDVVPNHVGPTHPWVEAPPSEHWLHGTRGQHLDTPDSFTSVTDPHAPARIKNPVIEGWFAGILPDMGTDDPVASQYLRQNALWWIETGSLDGLRLDTFPYIDRGFWRDFHAAIHQTYPRIRTVGEISNTDPTVTAYFAGGKSYDGIDTGLDTPFDFPLYGVIRKVVLENGPATEIEDLLRHDWMFPHSESLVTFLGNHDKKRFMSEPGASIQKLKVAFSLLLTLRGIPQLYAGDEIGMEGGEDPDNRRDFPGGFPGDAKNAFTAQGRTPAQEEVFEHVRSLLHFRQEHPALRGGRLIHIFSDQTAYAYVRQSETRKAETLLMVMNNSDDTRALSLNVQQTPLAGAHVAISELGAAPAEIEGSRIAVTVPARSLGIYEIQ